MNFKSLSLLAAAGLCTLSLCGSVSAAELRVATNPTFPPFEFQDSNTGTIQGFEMDLVAEIAKKLGDTVKIDKITFDGIVPAILSGSVDLGASGFSVTPERGKKVLFSLPFYKSGLTILVPKANKAGITDFDSLKGKRISVQLGTTSMQFAKKIPDAEITTFDHVGDAVLNMMAGNADAVINDKPVTDYMLHTNKTIAAGTTHLAPIATADYFAMVVAKNNTKLQQDINAALKQLKTEGTFDKLHEKWFGIPADPELLK